MLTRADGAQVDSAAFWRIFVAGALRYPETWISSGGEAVALWIPPNGTEMSAEQEEGLLELASELLGDRASSYAELLAQFESNHPHSEPHFYLNLFGTHPDHRGSGIGMRLLAASLEAIDAQHSPAYLESSNPANDNRYASVGFEPIGRFSHPPGGPEVTMMWRPAR